MDYYSQQLEPDKSLDGWKERTRPWICLAPMDGITDTAYRQIVRGLYRDVILFSEFTSAEGFLRSQWVRERLWFSPKEHPYFVQLFGGQPRAFAEAARILEDTGIAGVDINMGCPARRIVHSQHGSGLLRHPKRACEIVEAVAQATDLKVSVKTRLGWNSSEGLVDFVRGLVDAGASMLTIHGRTYDAGFRGCADWQPIYQLKQKVKIPVLGNGDIQGWREGMARLGNLDGFMIGRAAIGNPWVFSPSGREPSMEERVEVMKKHYWLLRNIKSDARRSLLEFRKHLAGYLKGFPLAKMERVDLLQEETEMGLMRKLEILPQFTDWGSIQQDLNKAQKENAA